MILVSFEVLCFDVVGLGSQGKDSTMRCKINERLPVVGFPDHLIRDHESGDRDEHRESVFEAVAVQALGCGRCDHNGAWRYRDSECVIRALLEWIPI